MFRLKELRLESGLKRSELAQALGIHQNTLANYENETRQAPYEFLIIFADYFDVSIDYLLGRDGDKIKTTSAVNASPPPPLSAKERELINDFRICSEKGKRRIAEYAKMWVSLKDNEDD